MIPGEEKSGEKIAQLLATKPVEPRGWFRWLHHHFAGRYNLQDARLEEELGTQQWKELVEQSPNFTTQLREELRSAVSLHAWAVGRLGLANLAESFWKELSQEERGAIVAGYTEEGNGQWNSHEWAKPRLKDCTFLPESACEVACNAIRHEWPDILKVVLNCGVDLGAYIHRGDIQSYPKSRWPERMAELSHRLIDLVLEAALVRNDTNAIRLALQKGANPNIPILRLERSFSEKHCPLGFAIDEERRELADMLLEADAAAQGTHFSSLNYPLHAAIKRGWDDFAARLLGNGASLEKETPENFPSGAADSKSEFNSPLEMFFGHCDRELKWAQKSIGSLIKLTSIEAKPAFYDGNGQGGQWRTILDSVVGDLGRLKLYESLGLDTRLTAEELCTAIDADAYEGLVYLLSKYDSNKSDRVLFRIRRKKPEFGAVRRELEATPQKDRCNDATDFDPQDQSPLVLPEGCKLYVDLNVIAAPGHSHGSILENHFWLRVDEAIYRRRKGQLKVKSFSRRWKMTKLPENRHQVKHSLPCIKETPDGVRIRLGVSIGALFFRVRDGKIQNLLDRWFDSEEFGAVIDEATCRIHAQDESNTRPKKPSLSENELKGYPPIFWPYLTRLETGYIGMTSASSEGDDAVYDFYTIWAQQNKTDDLFLPDPRLFDWVGWEKVPTELKPYFEIDSVFGTPSVRSPNNEYEKEMIHKAVAWKNEWMIPRALKFIEKSQTTQLRQDADNSDVP